MLKQEIKIRALNIEDDEVHFQMNLTNGVNSTSIDFYGYKDEFVNFAEGLCSYPKNIESEVKYELGEQGDKWAYYILLRIFCYERNGHSAIHIKVHNNRKEPYKNESEFYILTVPASINKFGQTLKKWNPVDENELEWTAE